LTLKFCPGGRRLAATDATYGFNLEVTTEPGPDVDIVTVTEYDAMGRVKHSRRDAAGAWTLHGYDAAGG
jgi:hypothetical protein